jgi:aminoglycoside 2'-N-acetyltransferase I
MIATMRIDLTSDHLLSAATRRQINELSDAVYPPGSTPDWAAAPIQWAPQTIRAMVWDDGGLVCHVGALVRSALMDGRLVLVGGIGGAMTAPEFRRRGHARTALAALRSHLTNDQQVAFSLLFCAVDLYGFCGQLGWRLFAGAPLVEQRGRTVEFTLNRAMVQDGTEIAPAGGILDLRGPPW